LVKRYNKDYAPLYGYDPITIITSFTPTYMKCKIAGFLPGALGKFSEN
jgi:hypothetical protein